MENWLDTANQTLEELPTTAKQYALSALDEMTVEAEELPAGSEPAVEKTVDPDTGAINLNFKIPGGGSGTTDYDDLENKPAIGGVELDGDKTLHELGIAAESAIPDVSGKANLSVVAPAFNQATANDPGSLVTYTDGVVYVLPDGHAAGATWANTTKTATNIAEQQGALLTAIQGLEDVCIKNTGVRIQSSNKSQYFSDFDDAPNNSIYEIASSAQMAHSPMGYGMSSASSTYDGTVRSVMGYPDGTLYTFAVSNTKQQIFITNRNGAGGTQGSTQILFFRVKAGNSYPWTDWTMASNVVSPSASNFAIRKVFIAPYLDGEGNPTATDTGIPNPQYIADDPFIFNDFDNAPNNSIYQIDLDCDASVMAHNPAPGKSSVLMTINFGYKTKHAEIQLCIGLKATNGGSFFFWRYGYNAAGGVYIFTPWSQISDVTVPAVSSTDNGKVLRVVNGEWAAVSLPSASGVSF